MIILGIDPGTATTGYGVIRIISSSSRNIQAAALAYGCIETSPKLSAGKRLQQIHNELIKLIQLHKPKLLAVESLYFFKNLKTAMPVSQAKGVILLAAAKKNIPVYEFTPLQVKMTVAGYGKAEKKQVQRMVQVILKLKEVPKRDDAADALGVALCCALQKRRIA